MDEQFDCARDAQRQGSRANLPYSGTERPAPLQFGGLLRRLGAAATALAVAYLVAPVRLFDGATRFPVACTGPHQDLAWTPLCSFQPDGSTAAPGFARADLERAEREVQAVRRT
jgi:hypothetical protein